MYAFCHELCPQISPRDCVAFAGARTAAGNAPVALMATNKTT
jgi:hypothetical protein